MEAVLQVASLRSLILRLTAGPFHKLSVELHLATNSGGVITVLLVGDVVGYDPFDHFVDDCGV